MKPMLSATMKDVDTINYPVLASPKLDGIRCLVYQGRAVSRNFKNIANRAIFEHLSKREFDNLDGELIVGDPFAPDVYRKTDSGVMTHEGEPPKWAFFVFDDFTDPYVGFRHRLESARERVKHLSDPRVRMVPHTMISTAEKLLEYETRYLLRGGEGVMGRSLHGAYKFGRSTLREGALWKLKRFTDGEAEVIGFDEQLHNANEAKKNALGLTERSSHKANKVPKGTLGALKVKDCVTGVEFDIGTGFSNDDRAEIWAAREEWLGAIVKYKSLLIGVKEKPRHPVYLGRRRDHV